MMLILMLIMMLKFCVNESRNLIGLENFCNRSFFSYCRVGAVLPIVTFSPWKPYTLYCYLKWEINVEKLKMFISGIFIKFSTCGVHFYKNLQFMIMKVCCRQKNFSLQLKFWKFPLQLLVSAEAYLYVKNLTCCFESLWARLTTSTWNDWINVWLIASSPHAIN